MACSQSLVALQTSPLANPRRIAQVAVSTGALIYLSSCVRRPGVRNASAPPVVSKSQVRFSEEGWRCLVDVFLAGIGGGAAPWN